MTGKEHFELYIVIAQALKRRIVPKPLKGWLSVKSENLLLALHTADVSNSNKQSNVYPLAVI